MGTTDSTTGIMDSTTHRGQNAILDDYSSGILPIAKLLQKPTSPPPDYSHYVDGMPWGKWHLPGEGDPYPTCGTYKVMGCLEHRPGYAKKVTYNCKRASCKTDWRTWLIDTVRKAKERIEAGKPRSYSKAIHVTVSPPRELWESMETSENEAKVRRMALYRLKIMGLFGGAVIYHPYRGSYKVKWRRAPHYHILGYGWVRNINRVAEKHRSVKGWVIKNLRIRKSVGATLYYQLSHAGVHENRHVIGWFGSLSWAKLQKIPDPPAPAETCPICGGGLMRVIFWGTGPNPFEGEAEELDTLDTVDWSYVT